MNFYFKTPIYPELFLYLNKKEMKFFSSLNEIASKGKAAFKRFPIVLLWAIIGTLFALYCIESKSLDTEFNKKILLIFSLGISWLISTRFFLEQLKKDKKWISIGTIMFLGFFYWSLPADNFAINLISWIRFCIYISLGHIFILVAPFVFEWNKESFFNHVKSVSIAIIRSLFFSFILFGGITLAFLAIENLFDVDVKSERYFQIYVFCMGIINTWIYLSDFPKNSYRQTTVNYPKALEVLVKYILIPLATLYLIILYAYSLKIIINWSLPKGWVSYLVIALSFLGFLIQLLINPIQKNSNFKTIKLFYPWFYFLLLPLIALLYVAIFRRVSEYGYTENRYIVLFLAIWILGMTLYMLLSKKKQIRYFSLSIITLFLITSFGFWGIFNVSYKSQLKRFKRTYNQIKLKNFEVTREEKNQFKDIIGYLFERDQLDKVEPILGYKPSEVFKKEKWSWIMSSKISDSLNIVVVDKKDAIEEIRNNFYSNLENEVFDIRGYDFFKKINIGFNNTPKNIKGYAFSLVEKSTKLKVTSKDKTVILLIDLKPLILNLQQIDNGFRGIDKHRMTIIKELKDFKIKLIFNRISMSKLNETTQDIEINNTDLYVFIKQKAL